MDYEGFFKNSLDQLRDEGNYRVFADLERRSGAFPKADRHLQGTVRAFHPIVIDVHHGDHHRVGPR